MQQSKKVIVIDIEGKEGIVEQNDTPTSDAEEVRVQLENGRVLILPLALLRRETATRYHVDHTFEALSEEGRTVIPVIKEEVKIKKKRVPVSTVHIDKTVHEEPKKIEETLSSEEVEVKNVPINRPVDEAKPARIDGDTLIVPLYEEVLVIRKQLMLREEVHISKKEVHKRESETVTLRREEVTVERIEE